MIKINGNDMTIEVPPHVFKGEKQIFHETKAVMADNLMVGVERLPNPMSLFCFADIGGETRCITGASNGRGPHWLQIHAPLTVFEPGVRVVLWNPEPLEDYLKRTGSK